MKAALADVDDEHDVGVAAWVHTRAISGKLGDVDCAFLAPTIDLAESSRGIHRQVRRERRRLAFRAHLEQDAFEGGAALERTPRCLSRTAIA